jgi:hypothetical protein
MTTISICHFNDVYRVTPQNISPTSTDTIDVTQFASLLHGIRDQWPQRSDGKRDGKYSISMVRLVSQLAGFRSCSVLWRCLFTFNREFRVQVWFTLP